MSDRGNDTTASEAESDEDFGQWHYGDGVCPSKFQFSMCFQQSYDSWAAAISTPPSGGTLSIYHMDDFLDILRDVPAFFHRPPGCVDVTGGGKYPLVLRSSLEVETTNDPACEQRLKIIDYFQCLGFRRPMEYSTLPPLDTSDEKRYFPNIVLAWSYIICSRWVEILQSAGEKSILYHAQDGDLADHFWDLIINNRWSAVVKRGKTASYAPWMLVPKGKKFKSVHRYVLNSTAALFFVN